MLTEVNWRKQSRHRFLWQHRVVIGTSISCLHKWHSSSSVEHSHATIPGEAVAALWQILQQLPSQALHVTMRPCCASQHGEGTTGPSPSVSLLPDRRLFDFRAEPNFGGMLRKISFVSMDGGER